MKIVASVSLVAALACGLAVSACGADKEQPPVTPPAPSASASAAPMASVSAAPEASSAAPVASAKPPPPTPKGKFNAFARSANFGKVDKVGAGDGVFKADGVKDFVFDADFEGPATAMIILSTDKDGQQNGDFTADTFVGDQKMPSSVAANLNEGKYTGGVAVYEGDKLLNAKDGSLTQLSDGPHKLTLYVSSKDASKDGAYKAMAVFDNHSHTASPVALPAAAATSARPATSAKPASSAAPKK